jgi:hypothetical protein
VAGGALLQHFAFAEAVALDCIIVLRDTKRLKGTLPQLFTSWERFARIEHVVDLAEFGKQGAKTSALLKQMQMHRDLRNGLAHGRLQCSTTGVAISWREVRPYKVEEKTQQLTWPQMLASLQSIEKLARSLSSQLSQLSQIRRLCGPSGQG